MDRRSFLVSVGLLPLIEAPPLVGDRLAFMLAPPLRRTAADAEKPTLLVGDSLAYMLAPRLWKVAKKEYGKKLYTKARGGTNAQQWIENHWFVDALMGVRPERVLISLGVNDHGVPVNRQKFPGRARRLVELAHQHHVKVVWLLPPKLRYPIDAVRKGIRESGADQVHDAEPLDIQLISDGIHPSAKGAEDWAEDLGRFLWYSGT
jgi:lysophospholipase L1-like esterase